MRSRLDTISPALTDEIAAATEDRQRAASLAVARLAASHTKPTSPAISAALDLLRSGKYEHGPVTASLQKLVDDFDDQYFAAQKLYEEGKGSEDECRAYFAKARLINSILCAFDRDAFKAAAGSTYELIAAINLDEPRAAVLAALRSKI